MAFVCMHLFASSSAHATLTCAQVWANDDLDFIGDDPLKPELLPAPLDNELIVPSSEDDLLARSQADHNAAALEKFGDLLSKQYIVAPKTEQQVILQNRLWSLFQTLYGIDADRGFDGEWTFKFFPPRPVEIVANQFGWSFPEVEDLLSSFHIVRIRRYRSHPHFLEAYRQIVDRNPVFGKTLADYEQLLRLQETREEWN